MQHSPIITPKSPRKTRPVKKRLFPLSFWIRFPICAICDNRFSCTSRFYGLRSMAPSSGLKTVERPRIVSRKLSGTPAKGDAAKRDDPLALARANARSISPRAREMIGLAHIVRMSTRRAGSVFIILLIKARSSGLSSKSICEKSSWRSWCQVSPLHNEE